MLTLHAFSSLNPHNNPVFLQMSNLLPWKFKVRKVPKLAASILVQAVWPWGWAVNQSAQVFKVNMFLRRMSWKKISGPGGRRPELCSLLRSLLWEFDQIAFLPSMGLHCLWILLAWHVSSSSLRIEPWPSHLRIPKPSLGLSTYKTLKMFTECPMHSELGRTLKDIFSNLKNAHWVLG